jgi:drug/metabolite transporter (DMT)-like permease
MGVWGCVLLLFCVVVWCGVVWCVVMCDTAMRRGASCCAALLCAAIGYAYHCDTFKKNSSDRLQTPPIYCRIATEPVWAVLVGWLLLGEGLSQNDIIGGFLIIFAGLVSSKFVMVV